MQTVTGFEEGVVSGTVQAYAEVAAFLRVVTLCFDRFPLLEIDRLVSAMESRLDGQTLQLLLDSLFWQNTLMSYRNA